MVFPIAVPLIAAAITAAGSIGGGYLSSRGQGKESKIQKQKRKLVDDLLASLNGGGKYGDLYSTDPDVFQKSFVEPAKARFRNEIAPQIQQQYIANGQQRGTGLDDQLLRAGVDMDQLLNQHWAQQHQNAQNRKLQTINSIFGAPSGVAQPSTSDVLSQSTGGYLASDSFKDAVTGATDYYTKDNNAPSVAAPAVQKARPGYSQDWRQWDNSGLGSPNWSNS